MFEVYVAVLPGNGHLGAPSVSTVCSAVGGFVSLFMDRVSFRNNQGMLSCLQSASSFFSLTADNRVILDVCKLQIPGMQFKMIFIHITPTRCTSISVFMTVVYDCHRQHSVDLHFDVWFQGKLKGYT